MESSIDGDIRLSVGVDTKEAEDDIKKIGKAVQDILKSIEKGTGDLSSKFDTLNNAVVNIASSLDEMKRYLAGVSTVKLPVEQLNRIIESISNVNAQVTSTEQEVEKANESAVGFSNTVAKMGQTKINLGTENLQEQLEQAKNQYETLKESFMQKKSAGELSDPDIRNKLAIPVMEAAENYERLQKAVAITQTTMTSFDNSSGEVSSKMLGLQANVNKAESAVIALEQKLAQMHTVRIPTEEFSELSKELQQLEEFKSFNPKGEYLEKTKADISNVQKKIAELYRDGKVFQDVTQTTGYQPLVNQLQAANAKLTEARQKLEERTQAENQDTDAINRNTEAVIRNNRTRNGGTGENTGGGTGGDTKQPESRLARVANTVGRGTLAIKGFTSTLSKYFSRLSGFVNKSNKDVDKNFKDINKTIRRSITNVLKYALGIRSIYFAFNKIRRAGIDSFKNLVKSSDEVNKTISETYSAFVNLKNAIGPAFQPLVSALAPVFTRLADSLTNATYKLGEFFAAITGQSYVYKAVKVQKDYAESLEKTSQKADKAQESLASFDKLNVLSSNKNDESAVDKNNVEYYTAPLSDTFSTLKTLIENQDWDGLGKKIAQKINNLFKKINKAVSWNRVGKKVTNTVKAFTETFNSLIDGISWELIGNTVGETINTIVNATNLLLTGINWKRIGSKFATGVNSIVKTVNWVNLGKMLGNWFMKSWKIFYGFVTNLDFKSVGQALAKGINGFFNNFDFSTITLSISEIINGISETMTAFVDETDWESVYNNIGDSIRNFFINTNVDDFLTSSGKFVDKIFDALTTAVKSVEWAKLGYEIGKAIQGTDYSEVGEDIGSGVGAVTGGALGLINGIIAGMFGTDGKTTAEQDEKAEKLLRQYGERKGLAIAAGISDGIVEVLYDFFNGLSTNFWDAFGGEGTEFLVETWWEDNFWQPLFDAMGFGTGFHKGYWADAIRDAGGDIGKGILDGIGESFYDLGRWIDENIFQFWVDAWNDIWDIHSPSKEGKKMGSYIGDGLLEGIAKPFENIGNWIKDFLFNPFISAFKSIWDIHSPSQEMFTIGTMVGNGLLNGISSTFNNISDWVKNNLFEPFMGAVQGLWNMHSPSVVMAGMGEFVGKGFLNGISEGFNYQSLMNSLPNSIPIQLSPQYQVPPLAVGTVVPANFGKFPAILGDNTKEPEVVSPVSTIEQAVENVLKRTGFFGDGNIEINLNVDGKALYSVIVNQDQMEKKRHGGRSRLGTV